MMKSSDAYGLLEEDLRASFAACDNFTEIVACSAKSVSVEEFTERQSRHAAFVTFFETAKTIFKTCVEGGYSAALRRALLHDSESFLPPGLHERLPARAWTTPLFFRTDESRSGRVFELQCPGSGWGDLTLLARLFQRISPHDYLKTFDPATVISSDIVRLCGVSEPCVLHLLDNASNPMSMKYLMTLTQPPLLYCGYSKHAASAKAHFVRSHSVFGLVSENFFRNRLRLCEEGKLLFDLPPLVIFDQKMMLALPFLDETRNQFEDRIRDILAYSYPVSSTGFRDTNGEWVTIDDFLRRPGGKRRYFLKYAGTDTNRNWGARAVYRLNTSRAATLLRSAVAEAEAGLPWIIQPEISEKETVEFFCRDSNAAKTDTLTAKYSAFYAPSGLVGLRTMHRNHHNVHGQKDTIIGLAVPNSGG